AVGWRAVRGRGGGRRGGRGRGGRPGDVAEFDTRTPHGVANAGPGTPVEYLVLFGPQGERPRPRTPPVPGPGVHQGLSGPRPRDSTGAPTSSTAPASSPRPDSGSDHDRCPGAS
ncbi:hypothetical protein ACFV2C_22160, partial [[Kitasatospora] papulosa]